MRLALAFLALAVVGGCASPPTDRGSDDVTVAFAGDVHAQPPIDVADPVFEAAFAPLAEADIAIVNLETAVATSGTPADKRFVFRADPSIFDRLTSWGVDVVTMANNHALDYGRAGLRQTLQTSKTTDLQVIGIGADVDQAFRPARVSVRGSTITFLTAKLDDDPTADPTAHWAATSSKSGVASATDPSRLLSAVEQHSDTGAVVVFLHWGVQGTRCPNADQLKLARDLREAGADVIVGAHSHTVQPMGRVGDTYVAYGLGNFMWRFRSQHGQPDGGVLTVTLAGESVTDATWIPHVRATNRSAPAALDRVSAADPLIDSCAE